LQVELTDREFEKLLAQEEKEKKAKAEDGKEKKEGRKKKKRRRYGGRPKTRVLNRKNDRRNKGAMNESKSDESGDEVKLLTSFLTAAFVEFRFNKLLLLVFFFYLRGYFSVVR